MQASRGRSGRCRFRAQYAEAPPRPLPKQAPPPPPPAPSTAAAFAASAARAAASGGTLAAAASTCAKRLANSADTAAPLSADTWRKGGTGVAAG